MKRCFVRHVANFFQNNGVDGLASQPKAYKQTGAPLDVMDSQLGTVTDICEIENHRCANEHIAKFADHSPTSSDNDLGEVIVKWDAFVIDLERRVAIDGKRGKSGKV